MSRHACRLLEACVTGSERGCNILVDVGGLKLIFPMFMQRALQDGSDDDRKSLQSQTVNVILQTYLHASSSNVERLLVKFEENEFEKVKRLVDIH